MAQAPRTIRLNEADNVVVACAPIAPRTPLGESGVTALDRVPSGHKVATRAIPAGRHVIKYGQIIGAASADIAAGGHVHTHNCAMAAFERDYAFCQGATPTAYVPGGQRRTFAGFRRPSGRVGTRNYIAVLSSVNCSATVANHVAAEVERSGMLEACPDIDGIVALTHGTGCGMADNGDGYDILQRTMWGYAQHPNVGGVLMIGLGCEVNQIPFLLEAYGLEIGPRFQTMTIQSTGGTRKTVDAAVATVRDMLPAIADVRRQPVPVAELTVALQCGGSDAYSGITANPALGHAADRIVAEGGTVILAETPEIYGAEHLLTRRSETREVGQRLIDRIAWWEDYVARNFGSMDNNPSPGNKAGGLTTILEKSLGAAIKGGTTNLTGVYKYAERVAARGFTFMDSPGYDPCSVTGQVASGATMVCFTTGRGSVFGCKPSPSIKIATNSAMYARMEEDMDVNAGPIIDGAAGVAEVGDEIFEHIVRVAGGAPSKSEALGFGGNEFVPWQVGATM